MDFVCFSCRSLWCGGSQGTMSVFCLRDDGLVMSQDAVTHFTTSTPPPSDSSADVLILHAPQNLSSVSPHLRNSIWSYVYPGKGKELQKLSEVPI